MTDAPILRVSDLSKQYGPGCTRCRPDGGLDRQALERNYCANCHTVHALDAVSLDLYPAEVLGIVGESGSGKSTIMGCLYFDIEPTVGTAFLESIEDSLFDLSDQQKRRVKNEKLGMVYQNPVDGLKMSFSALANIAEKLIAAGGRHVTAMRGRAETLLDHVNIPTFRMTEAPKRFSGGMQQRVQIAKALSNNPPVLLLDEVTTGLDLSVQAKVLDLIKVIQRELSISMLLVSHDLAVVRMLADRTMVMLNGEVVERGLTDQILEDPQHPYTQELVQSLL